MAAYSRLPIYGCLHKAISIKGQDFSCLGNPEFLKLCIAQGRSECYLWQNPFNLFNVFNIEDIDSLVFQTIVTDTV